MLVGIDKKGKGICIIIEGDNIKNVDVMDEQKLKEYLDKKGIGKKLQEAKPIKPKNNK